MPAPASASVTRLTYQCPTSSQALFAGLSLPLPRGFTAVVGPNGAGKSTLLRLLCGELSPDEGELQLPRFRLYCAQRTDEPPVDLEDFLFDDNGETQALISRLGLDAGFLYRWDMLSHGERKRCQIGWALWKQPDLLAIDEPSNHIDSEARQLLAQALTAYRGIGLLVSHDRSLMDALCAQCLYLSSSGARLYPGNYSAALAQRRQDQHSAQREQRQARDESRRLERELHRRREDARRSHRERSKRGLSARDHDAKARKDLARVTNKDGQAGRLLRQLEGRAAQAGERAASLVATKQYAGGIWLPGTQAPRDLLLHLPAGEIALPDGSSLRQRGLSLRRRDRIVLRGANGTGKSTLLRHLLSLHPVPEERLLYLPQEVSAAEGRVLLDRIRSLDDRSLGQMMTVVSRLGSRPERLLESPMPSPGELRKLMLAEGMTRQPWLLVLDEPTNHLDLPSLEALEGALRQCPCALLLVSHDETFLRQLGEIEWCIRARACGNRLLTESRLAPLS